MKFGIIKELKNPSERRVAFSPDELAQIKLQYQDISIKVESSNTRIFSDQEYQKKSIEVTNDSSDCDVFFGVNEVPVELLIPNKTYFFSSNILKKQPDSRPILQALLEKKNDFYDYETLLDSNNQRIVGFEKQAGIVGAYNSIRAFGIKFEMFKLPKAETLSGKEALITYLKRIILPPLKFVVSGKGGIGNGVKEVFQALKIKEVSVENYLTKKYTQAVFTQIEELDYNKRIDGKVFDYDDFIENPQEYESDFERFSKVSDIYIAAHFHVNRAPKILTRENLQDKDCKIKIVADIACEVNGSIACTLRSSTIVEPLYGYWPTENKEVDVFYPAAIVVMAVDNLPNELPKESSQAFGKILLEHVIPAFFDGDKDGILQRAKITENGKLTPRFSYLQDFVDGK